MPNWIDDLVGFVPNSTAFTPNPEGMMILATGDDDIETNDNDY